MIKKKLMIIPVLLLFLGALGSCLFQSCSSKEWHLDQSLGFPMWLAFNQEIEPEIYHARKLVLYVEPKDFSEENLYKSFTHFASIYNSPQENLYISAFNSKECVQKDLTNFSPDTIIYEPTMKEYDHDRTCLCTYYSRVLGKEVILYRLTSDKTQDKTVILKKQFIPYTGDRDSDFILAAGEGDKEQVELLLSQGASANTKDKDGRPALLEALLNQQSEIAKLLITRGADIQVKDRQGWTPLMYVASHGNLDLVQDLVRRGANVDAKDDLGDTALSLATSKSPKELVRLLLANGAGPNTANKLGLTPLMNAAEFGNLEVVQELLTWGADLRPVDNRGMTALSIAIKRNMPEIAQLLINAGAKNE